MDHVQDLLTTAITTKIWHLLILAFVLLNVKNLPLVWHFRLARVLLAHLPFNRFSNKDSASIFRPVIISSRSPILECDYNLHKSNSTFFSDLDISRTHLLTCLLGNGINQARLSSSSGEAAAQGRFGLFVGGVTCQFKKEIKPYEKYEIWTRVLCWDEKWLYLVSHFVKAGTVEPRSYTLQPWRKASSHTLKAEKTSRGNKTFVRSTVLASSIAKYVFKRGNFTIMPETILEATNLLPAKLEAQRESCKVSSPAGSTSGAESTLSSINISLRRVDAEETIDELVEFDVDSSSWDWVQIETERERGMQIAKLFTGLDDLHAEFRGEKQHALARN